MCPVVILERIDAVINIGFGVINQNSIRPFVLAYDPGFGKKYSFAMTWNCCYVESPIWTRMC